MNLRSPSVLIAVVALLVLVGGGAALATSQGGGLGLVGAQVGFGDAGLRGHRDG